MVECILMCARPNAGKHFRVCTLSITDPGDSDIIRIQEGQQ
jgi:hypothetical protein